MRVLFWFSFVIILILAVAFTAENLERVDLGLWPLPGDIRMPLFAALLGALFIGFVLGMLYGYIRQGKWRSLARHALDENERRKREVDVLKADLKRAQDDAGRVSPHSSTAIARNSNARNGGVPALAGPRSAASP